MGLNGTILIAEDEHTARRSLSELFESRGYKVIQAEDGAGALRVLLGDHLDAALLDVRMPGMDGLNVLERARHSGLDVPVIVMTAHGDSGTVIRAMRLGAYDHVAKPIDFGVVLAQVAGAISRRETLRRQVSSRGQAEQSDGALAMVGYSPAMQRVYKFVGQVAASDVTVMIRGETGTGKELVVNAIHHNSARSSGPFVKVNCAAIPETLLESELFGHERGAFTGAVTRRIGHFERADRGTLFLDEIGELTPLLQSKLLRAVQERVVERLGGETPVPVDLRMVAATSRNLEEAVSRGEFREDLYYRLNVVSIELPPLRDRRQDISPLVNHFLSRRARPVSITPAALEALYNHDWPGNVRELENTVERAAVLAKSGLIDTPDIELNLTLHPAIHWTGGVPLEPGWKANIGSLEKSMLVQALRQAGGNKSRAAESLGIHRRLLYEKIREHGVD